MNYEFVYKFVNRVAAVLSEIKRLLQPRSNPRCDLRGLNAHGELFEHLIEEGQDLLELLAISNEQVVLAILLTLIVDRELLMVTDQRLEPWNVLQIVRMGPVCVVIAARVDKIGESMVGSDELKLYLIVHANDEVLEFGEAELVPIEFEGQLPFQIDGKLGQRDALLVLGQDLND